MLKFRWILYRFRISNYNILNLPTPTSLLYLWNFGSLLGLTLIIQLISGIFLAMHYISDSSVTFNNLFHINRDVCLGWMLRYIHINCASFFFIFVYIHISRNIYYTTYLKKGAWFTGIILLLLMMICKCLRVIQN